MKFLILNFVEYFQSRGINAQLFRLGFDESVFAALADVTRDIPLSFVGSLTPDHKGRRDWLTALTGRSDTKPWGPSAEVFAPGSPIRSHYQGPTWGRETFRVLRRSKITLNYHIGIVGQRAQEKWVTLRWLAHRVRIIPSDRFASTGDPP